MSSIGSSGERFLLGIICKTSISSSRSWREGRDKSGDGDGEGDGEGDGDGDGDGDGIRLSSSSPSPLLSSSVDSTVKNCMFGALVSSWRPSSSIGQTSIA